MLNQVLRKSLREARGSKRRSDEGAVMPVVLMVSLFIFAVIVSITATAAAGVTATSANRSVTLQLADIESGRDVILADLTEGVCEESGVVEGDHSYAWQIYHTSSDTVPSLHTDAGVTAGCPESGTKYVLVRVGTNPSFTSGRSLTAVYEWSQSLVTSTRGGGSIVSGGNLEMNGFGISSVNGVLKPSDIVVTNGGNFSCPVVAAVVGRLYVSGNVDLRGCANLNSINAVGNITSHVTLFGDMCSQGNITGLHLLGNIRRYQAECHGLARVWPDYNPIMTDSIKLTDRSNGSAYCNNSSWRGLSYKSEGWLAYELENATSPTTFDLRGCSGDVTLEAGALSLFQKNIHIRTDVTIVAKGFKLDHIHIRSANGAANQFNIVTPDYTVVDPSQPHCTDRRTEIKRVWLIEPIIGLAYTPCKMDISGTLLGSVAWRGQVIMGSGSVMNGALEFYPMNLTSTTGDIDAAAPSNAGVIVEEDISHAGPVILSQVEG